MRRPSWPNALPRGCPGLTVLATSREGLAIGAEALWPVPPLDAHEATELFVERATALAPDFSAVGAEDRAVIEDLCQRLDGLPLAIELAAARIRVFGPHSSGPSRRPVPAADRRRRGRAATSADVTGRRRLELRPARRGERRLFERLAVFAAAWTMDAAVALAGDIAPDRATLEELVGRLVDKSLVVPAPTAAGRRFRLLQTLAFYGRERLAERPEAGEVRDRRPLWFADVATAAGDGVRTSEQQAWLERIDAELDDLRVAIDWAIATRSTEAALRLAAGMSWPFWLRNEITEAFRWCGMALELEGGSSAQRRAPWAGTTGPRCSTTIWCRRWPG